MKTRTLINTGWGVTCGTTLVYQWEALGLILNIGKKWGGKKNLKT